MNNVMKSYNFLITLITSIMLCAGCSDSLSKDPIGLLTPEQVNLEPTVTSVRYSVNSSYQLLSNTLNIIGNWGWEQGTVLRNDFVLQDIASDDVQKKWNPDGDQAWMDQLDNFSFIASNPAFNGQWTYNYEGVSRANTAINYLTNDAMMTKLNFNSDERNRLLGEVYFLRAFYYFDLVTNFQGVPLLIKPLNSFNEAYEVAFRADENQVWEQIRNDLSLSKKLLPNSKYSHTEEKWRVSKGAVIALQAKVALFNEEWQSVINSVNELESTGFYALNENYFDCFDVNKQFEEQEVIFCYNHESAQIPKKGNGLCALLGWGFVAPEADFINAFEPNDPRLLYTVDINAKNINKILGTVNGTYKGDDDAPSNKIYIRYADVLLWKAEALLKMGNLQESINLINNIRQRARNSATADGSLVPNNALADRNIHESNISTIMNWLIHERRVELGFESHRFRDLKRWGLSNEVLTTRGFKNINNVFPIPQKEIDQSGGSITQNKGY